MICSDCGTVGSVKTVTPGGCLVEIVLWAFFLVPGLIYTIWRRTSRKKVCAKCGGSTLLPLDTPGGIAAAQKFKAN